MSETSQQGRYLFAVARGVDEPSMSGVAGLREAPIEFVKHLGLQAVVCTVDLDEFGEEQLARNLEDLGWLEQVARRHNEVVFAVASAGTVAPMRLVTICSDDDSVRQRIDVLHDDLCRVLDRVEGRREWSVKVYAAPQERSETDDSEPPASGAAYLQRKRELAQKRRSAGEDSLRVAEDIHEVFSGHAAATRVLPPQDPRLTGRKETMILNGAYLVPDSDSEGFRGLVNRLVQLHPTLQIECEGPWPPYSFATLD